MCGTLAIHMSMYEPTLKYLMPMRLRYLYGSRTVQFVKHVSE